SAVYDSFFGNLSAPFTNSTGGKLMVCWNHPNPGNPGYTLSGNASVTCDGNEQPSTNGCVLHYEKNLCPIVADPVDAIGGVLREEMTDFTTSGDHHLFLKRYYWSDRWTEVTSASRLGAVWSTNFDAAASYFGSAQSPYSITIRMPDGRVLSFNVSGQNITHQVVHNFVLNSWKNLTGVTETLSYAGNGNWVLVDKDDMSYTFNSSGQLVTLRYRDG
ncbi:MAG: DUF6531 domain-containing protein, partial [Candidatus Binatia bacterium]